MAKSIIQTDDAPQAIGTYSQAVKVDNTVYISGQIPLDPVSMEICSSEFESQARQVFANLAAVAEAARVKARIHVPDAAFKPRQQRRVMEALGQRAAFVKPRARLGGVTRYEAPRVKAAGVKAAGVAGLPGLAGDYPAIAPIAPSGLEASASHITWNDRKLVRGEATYFEVSGCYHRYHCPASRTLYLGEVPTDIRRAEEAVLQAIEDAFAAARPGVACEDVAACVYENPFAGGPECREYRGAGWNADTGWSAAAHSVWRSCTGRSTCDLSIASPTRRDTAWSACCLAL